MAIAREIDAQVRPIPMKTSLLIEVLKYGVSRSIRPGECNTNQHWSCQGRVKNASTAGLENSQDYHSVYQCKHSCHYSEKKIILLKDL
jgi:hypothetical protein